MPAGERNYDSTGARAALSNSSVVLRMASTPALGLQMLRLPARIQLTLLVRDEAGILYHTDPVSLKW